MFQSSSSLSLRPATPEDAATLAALKVASWRADYVGLMPQASLERLNATEEVPHWRNWLADEKAGLIAYVAEVGGKPVGYGLAGPMRLGDRPGEEIEADGEIYALCLLPNHQRQGLGKALFTALVGAMIERGFRSAGFWMIGGNRKAEGFLPRIEAREWAKRVEIRHGRISFREKGWLWQDLKQLQARLTVKLVERPGEDQP